jgi:phospholipid transport system substrate-binding protein
MNKFILLTLCCLLVTIQNTSLSAALPPPESASEVIEELNATLLECMKKGDELGYSGRYALLAPFMKKYFFYSLMVKKSTGSYWKTMNGDQQEMLLKKYITWSVGSYADKFKKYKGQQIAVVSTEPVRKKYMRVNVEITKADKRKRHLEYLLIEDKTVWRIVDIKVKGVSQLSLTRAQFKSVLKKQGISGLLDIIDEKIKALNQDGGG